MYPIKLKLDMIDHMNNTFRRTVFQISADVLLIQNFHILNYGLTEQNPKLLKIEDKINLPLVVN